MEIRDAVEDDASSLAAISGVPVDAMRTIIHDRSVRVAVESTDDPAHDDSADEPVHDDRPVLGFVSFDAQPNVVHVTQLDGGRSACERLLEEPIAFARHESMSVEFLVPEDETEVRDVATAAGFERIGQGPRFEGRQTVRYRLEDA